MHRQQQKKGDQTRERESGLGSGSSEQAASAAAAGGQSNAVDSSAGDLHLRLFKLCMLLQPLYYEIKKFDRGDPHRLRLTHKLFERLHLPRPADDGECAADLPNFRNDLDAARAEVLRYISSQSEASTDPLLSVLRQFSFALSNLLLPDDCKSFLQNGAPPADIEIVRSGGDRQRHGLLPLADTTRLLGRVAEDLAPRLQHLSDTQRAVHTSLAKLEYLMHRDESGKAASEETLRQRKSLVGGLRQLLNLDRSVAWDLCKPFRNFSPEQIFLFIDLCHFAHADVGRRIPQFSLELQRVILAFCAQQLRPGDESFCKKAANTISSLRFDRDPGVDPVVLTEQDCPVGFWHKIGEFLGKQKQSAAASAQIGGRTSDMPKLSEDQSYQQTPCTVEEAWSIKDFLIAMLSFCQERATQIQPLVDALDLKVCEARLMPTSFFGLHFPRDLSKTSVFPYQSFGLLEQSEIRDVRVFLYYTRVRGSFGRVAQMAGSYPEFFADIRDYCENISRHNQRVSNFIGTKSPQTPGSWAAGNGLISTLFPKFAEDSFETLLRELAANLQAAQQASQQLSPDAIARSVATPATPKH